MIYLNVDSLFQILPWYMRCYLKVTKCNLKKKDLILSKSYQSVISKSKLNINFSRTL